MDVLFIFPDIMFSRPLCFPRAAPHRVLQQGSTVVTVILAIKEPIDTP